MTPKGSFTEFPVFSPAEMHSMVLHPDHLFPACLHNFFDHVLIGAAVRTLPGVEHMVDRFIKRIFRANSSQTSLGGLGMGFLRICHFGYGHYVGAWSFL